MRLLAALLVLPAVLALAAPFPTAASPTPARPTHLTALGLPRSGTARGASVLLQWQTGPDARACLVSRDGTALRRVPATRPGLWRYMDSTVSPGLRYVYTVTATGRLPLPSLPSAAASVVVPPVVNIPALVLPTPTLLTARSDDDNAVLTWSVPGTANQNPLAAGPLRPDQQEPAGVAGFVVSWGPQDNPRQYQRLSTERIVQLQPLAHGVIYAAAVQCVDALGDVSPFSAPVLFAHDPARVDALRAQMTGFFDDFNTPAGPFDERKWNTSYAAADDPALSGAFVNTQFHAHDMVSNAHGFGDREWVMNRPRAVFDVAGRTGTLVFDMDGEQRRDQWYLDLVPETYAQGVPDTTGQSHLEDETVAAAPGSFLRIHQNEQTIGLYYINAQGREIRLASTDWTQHGALSCAPLDWQGVKLVRNVRRRWRIQYSQTHCAVFIDDVPILAADYPQAPTRVVPLWLAFSYNTLKGNEPVMLLHWDNFGFDGPPALFVTHNYKAALDASDFAELLSWLPGGGQHTYTLHIPDSVDSGAARRLMLSLTCRTQTYQWSASDHVSVNGNDYPLAEPSDPTGLPSSTLVSGISGYPVIVNLPEGVLHTGDNLVTVAMASGGVMNVHAELDWPRGSEPPYTTPMAIYNPDCAGGTCPPGEAMPGMPPMPLVGPGTYITAVGNAPTPYLSDDSIQGLMLPASRSADYGYGPGLLPVTVRAGCDTDLASTGTIHGIHHITLCVDGAPLGTVATHAAVPAPASTVTFLVDLARLADGPHALFATAFAESGTPGAVDYDGALGKPDLDYSLHIHVGP